MPEKKSEQKPKLTPKGKKAVAKLQSIEDALLTVQATVGSYVREVQDVKAMFLGTDDNKEGEQDVDVA